jgi:hypothetical protein
VSRASQMWIHRRDQLGGYTLVATSALPRQPAVQSGEQRTVTGVAPRPPHLPAEHHRLLAQDQNLCLVGGIRAKPQDDQLEHAPEPQ